jgi:hypothetical protein
MTRGKEHGPEMTPVRGILRLLIPELP